MSCTPDLPGGKARPTWFLVVLVHAALAQAPSATAQAAPDVGETAEATSERMLVALGGRRAWADVTALVNDSFQHRSEAPNTVRARISMDFRSPRWRIETTAPGLHLIRVWDGTQQQGWRLSKEGALESLPEATRDEDLRWHRAHVYRTLHRIAARDRSVQVRLGEGQLEVYEGEQRIAWYRLSSNGEPYAFGAMDDNDGSRCGPWSFDAGGLRHPIWVANASGTWRANLHALEVNPELDPSLFARPRFLAGLSSLHGAWLGSGQFQGREAELSLHIEPVLAAAFTQWQLSVRLTPAAEPLFSGLLHSKRDLEGLHGDWRDSSGDRLRVRSEFRADCLHSDWEKGRSSYCLDAKDRLLVTDYAAGAQQPFAQYRLERSKTK